MLLNVYKQNCDNQSERTTETHPLPRKRHRKQLLAATDVTMTQSPAADAGVMATPGTLLAQSILSETIATKRPLEGDALEEAKLVADRCVEVYETLK